MRLGAVAAAARRGRLPACQHSARHGRGGHHSVPARRRNGDGVDDGLRGGRGGEVAACFWRGEHHAWEPTDAEQCANDARLRRGGDGHARLAVTRLHAKAGEGQLRAHGGEHHGTRGGVGASGLAQRHEGGALHHAAGAHAGVEGVVAHEEVDDRGAVEHLKRVQLGHSLCSDHAPTRPVEAEIVAHALRIRRVFSGLRGRRVVVPQLRNAALDALND